MIGTKAFLRGGQLPDLRPHTSSTGVTASRCSGPEGAASHGRGRRFAARRVVARSHDDVSGFSIEVTVKLTQPAGSVSKLSGNLQGLESVISAATRQVIELMNEARKGVGSKVQEGVDAYTKAIAQLDQDIDVLPIYFKLPPTWRWVSMVAERQELAKMSPADIIDYIRRKCGYKNAKFSIYALQRGQTFQVPPPIEQNWVVLPARAFDDPKLALWEHPISVAIRGAPGWWVEVEDASPDSLESAS